MPICIAGAIMPICDIAGDICGGIIPLMPTPTPSPKPPICGDIIPPMGEAIIPMV